MYFNAGVSEHVDKSVEREAGDLAAHEVGDARLADVKAGGGGGLGHAFFLDQLAEGGHHGGAHLEVAGFGGGEAKVGEDVAAAFGDYEIGGLCHMAVAPGSI